ncbi:prolipoprotein diacylglyceryl transferase [Solwaraspora sp. WMMD1047]|uniref:prolipoprotein diacylglyceryl transferase n=1 Tax=Solwaraspora sp. WMMD1047 TaxID=3016102 RepID=UPI002417A306|nr:prolipoprotein diacylglyceryl transferase [Solwaraspora sp. WMMD1047]MDG4832054.1 prolipoprotein diacylglyceryl transferase [Solwaraspora sp. WMMD1047]
MTLASLPPLAALPSPTTAIWELGPLPIRAYALCIVLGIVAACAVTEARLRQRGVAPWAVLDIAVWAVPAGIIGARIYHVITSPGAYFGADGNPIEALYIWQGGLGIWGAVAGGAVGAWWAARQLGIPFAVVADALAPGLPLAQAIGRFGNWFNNELYGGPTTLPWGLEIHRMDSSNPGHALRDENGNPILEPGLYHPTFLYEVLWNVGVAALVYLVDRRFKLGRGRAFALYVMGYTVGRFWIELMRTDPANLIGGVRLNVWTSVLVFAGALIYFLRVRGPQEYLIPLDADGTGLGRPVDAGTGAEADRPAADRAGADAAEATEPAGGVSQVRLSERPAPRADGQPAGYRVVTEEQFHAYQRTGQLPADPATDDATEPASAADATEPASVADATEPAAPGAATEPAAAGDADADAAPARADQPSAAGEPDEPTGPDGDRRAGER